jgi:cytochrome P450
MTLQTDSRTATEPYQSTPRIEKDAEGIWHIHGYAEARDLLKEDLLQDGFGAEGVLKTGLDPVLYQRGEPHRRQRAAIAKYFSPTTVAEKHLPMMERAADEVLAELIKAKRMDLKTLSKRMAAIVTCAVVGLHPTAGMIRRLDTMLHSPQEKPNSRIGRFLAALTGNLKNIGFLLLDVRPAIAERKRAPKDDVISYMLSKGKDQIAILAECIVYGAAGMATTQEFICVVLMQALENPQMRSALTSDDINIRYEALHEILRLDPVIGKIKRIATDPVSVSSKGEDFCIPADAKIEFHVYDVNADAQSVIVEPERLHAHRDLGKGTYRSLIGFGSGSHRCAGEHLAISETDVFIRRLLALRGLRVEKQPTVIYNKTVEGYEISDLIVSVE